MPKHARTLELNLLPQPDDTTCGPTSLHAVYNYWNDDVPLEQVIAEVANLPEGGTLAVLLACHALRRGYDAEIYTYNLQIFDPSWFDGDVDVDIAEKLRAQKKVKRWRKLTHASDSYLEFLELGGKLRFEELNAALLDRFLVQEIPILTGLSATYLYGCAREHENHYDDVQGEPMGHFVVICGYDPQTHEVQIADPLGDNPGFQAHFYRVETDRLIAAILLGIVTYDANLLVITPRDVE